MQWQANMRCPLVLVSVPTMLCTCLVYRTLQPCPAALQFCIVTAVAVLQRNVEEVCERYVSPIMMHNVCSSCLAFSVLQFVAYHKITRAVLPATVSTACNQFQSSA